MDAGVLPKETPALSFEEQVCVFPNENNRYVGVEKKVSKDKDTGEERVWEDRNVLSNFTLDLLRAERRVDTDERNCSYIMRINPAKDSVLHLPPMEVTVQPKDLKPQLAFETLMLGKGRFVFNGNDRQYRRVLDITLNSTDAPEIWVKDVAGYDPSNGAFFAKNGAVTESGKLVKADDSGLIVVGRDVYRLAQPQALKGERPEQRSTLPVLKFLTQYPGYDPIERILKPFVTLIKGMYGDDSELSVAWTLSMPYSDKFFDLTGNHPLCLIHGPKGRGKNQLGQMLMQFFGITNKPSSILQMTITALYTKMNTYSNVPVWVDEYKPTIANDDVREALKNSYDRSYRDVGTLDQFKLKTRKIRTSVMLTGEYEPTDAALASRNIAVGIEPKHDLVKFEQAKALAESLSAVTVYMLEQKHQIWPRVEERFKTVCATYRESFPDIEIRTIENYAKMVAIMEPIWQDETRIDRFAKAMQQKQVSTISQCPVVKMLDTISYVVRTKRVALAHRVDRKAKLLMLQATEFRETFADYSKDRDANGRVWSAVEIIRLARDAKLLHPLHNPQPVPTNMFTQNKDGNWINCVQRAFQFDMRNPFIEEIANGIELHYGTGGRGVSE